MNWRDVPIPELMARLDRDSRGLPIPFLVQRDARTGRPYFTINDMSRHRSCLKNDLCAICGQKLQRGRWFFGGPLSAFHERGAYIDTPTHDSCCHYALQVCPYLAAPVYAKRIDGQLFDWEANPHVFALQDQTMLPDRPPVFAAVMAIGQRIVERDGVTVYVKPNRPYRKEEFWRHGQRIPDDEGWAITEILIAGADRLQPESPSIKLPATKARATKWA